MKTLLRRLQFFFHRRQFDADLEEELRDHLHRKTLDTGNEAGARRQFGNVTLTMEDSRNAWSWNLLEQMIQDGRYAWRAMRANKLFTLMAVLSLALGIGANTAIYSFMDAVLIRGLPVRRTEQLVILNWRSKGEAPVVTDHWGSSYDEKGGGLTCPNFPYTAYELLRDRNDVLTALFGHASAGRLNLVIDGQAELAEGELVSGDYFTGLGVGSAVGRVLGRDDDRKGAPPVVILSYDFWRSRFGSDSAVLGKTVQLNRSAFTIAGVAAPEFYGVSPASRPKLFLPLADIGLVEAQISKDWAAGFTNRHFYWLELMGRLKPGTTLAQAQAQLEGSFHNFVASTATKDRERVDLPRLWLQEGGSGVDAMRRNLSQPLWILMSMVGLILLIACANIANLLLARAATRRREMAVRLSLGAGRFRIVRQLLTESLILALTGAACGLGIAALGIRVLRTSLSDGEDLTVRVGLDWRVLAFTIAIAIVTGILFGLAPALQSTRADVAPALKESRVKGSGSHGKRVSLNHILVVGQIALSLLLVVAAGLFVKTLSNLHAVQLGFNAEHVLVFNLDASKAGYTGEPLKQFYDGLQSRLQAAPGVRAATSSDMPLVAGWNSSTGITVPGIPKPPEGQRGPSTAVARVGTTFFETMEMPIVSGRALNRGDVEGAPPAVVVNPAFADKYFKGQNPVGRHFRLGGDESGVDVEIVGVVRTARYSSLKREIPPVTYTSWMQANTKDRPVSLMFFEVRTSGDPMAMANTVRQIVREASPLVPVQGLTTQTERIDRTIRQERTFAQLCTCFGALALLMAGVGLYGSMAYAVARRTNEIGIRMALGAVRGRIVWMVLREVLVLAGFGVAIGFAAVYQATSLVQSFLFGLKPNDPTALIVSVGILLACALVAGFMPARRASRIDPIVALRHE